MELLSSDDEGPGPRAGRLELDTSLNVSVF